MFSLGVAFALVASAFLVASALITIAPASAQECQESQARPCGSNVGACGEGSRVCSNGVWGECTGGTAPAEEVCGNGVDDDCDGYTDNCQVVLWQVLIIVGVIVFVFSLIFSMTFAKY